MDFRRLVIAAAVLSIFAAGAFTAFQVADSGQDAAPDTNRTATNESITVEYDAYQFVDNATAQYTTGFGESVTVYNSSNGELTAGEDYEWNSSDGTIIFRDTNQTTEGATASITYNYTTNTAAVREVSGPVTAVTRGVGWTALLAGGLALVVVLLAIGGFVAQRIGNSGLPKTNR